VEPPRARPAEARGSGKLARFSLGMTTALAVAAAALAALPASAARTTSAVTKGGTVTVHLFQHAVGTLPAGYLGLSFESGSTVNSGQLDNVGNLPRLLENLGTGGLRFGGNSVDRSYLGVRPFALAGLARLVRATGWHVIYSVNLGNFSAGQVTADARAVGRALRGHLTAIACGNEPDHYARGGLRPSSYTETDYLAEASTCIQAVHKGAPRAHISGPNTFHLTWLPQYAAAEKGTISQLAEQYYPLNDCHGPSGTPATLLSRHTAATEADVISTAAAAARTAGVPLQITETNTAACGGITGISNTYVSALWAVDYLLTGAEHGASGMNFHGSLTGGCAKYTPLCQVGTSQYAAQPVYYGLLFTHMLGTGRLLHVTVRSAHNIAAHAIRAADGRVRVVIENLSGVDATIFVRAGAVTGSATVLQLTGPSLAATTGIRIEGKAVRANGTFAAGAPSHVDCRAGICRVPVRADSAVIVMLPRPPHPAS
jgi:hypothetical protein